MESKEKFEKMNEILGLIAKSSEQVEDIFLHLERIKKELVNSDDIVLLRDFSLLMIDFLEIMLVDLSKQANEHKKFIEEKIKSGKI